MKCGDPIYVCRKAVVPLLLRTVASVVLTMLATAPSAWAASPAVPAPTVGSAPYTASADIAVVCANAERALQAGQIDSALSLLQFVAADAPAFACVTGIQRAAATQRQDSNDDVSRGQQALATGELSNARTAFEHALTLDAASTPAQQGFAQVAQLSRPNTTATSNWNTFYADRVEPAYRLLGAFLALVIALYVLSALVSRWLVRVDAVVWPPLEQRGARVLGTLLVLGSAAFLPIYTMFKPFTEANVVPLWSEVVVLGVLGIFLALYVSSCARFHPQTVRAARWRLRRFLSHWWPPMVWLLASFGAAAILWVFALTEAYPRLLITYCVIVAFGVIIMAASFGQNCRLQVQAMGPNGSSDEASTDYLLTRLRTLGRERTGRGLDVANLPASMSALQDQDLSGIPAGRFAGALAKILFAVRPDLTWRAQVTIVDDGRAALRLSRNGRLAACGVFSRSELSLSSVASIGPGAKDSVARARAQLLTGAAAFILLSLSTRHPRLRRGLCGATDWRSVTLQVIACSRSLAQGEDALALLRSATTMDPGNAIARYEYIHAISRTLSAPYDATVVKMYHALTEQAPADKEGRPGLGWGPVYLRILYSASIAALNVCVNGLPAAGKTSTPDLVNARSFVDKLSTACKSITIDGSKGIPEELEAAARQLQPLAENLSRIVDVLDKRRWDHATHDLFESPALAFNYACLEALSLRCLKLRSRERDAYMKGLLEDLAFAVPTEKTKAMAREDPYLKALVGNKRVARLIGTTKATGLLDLSPFTSFRGQLTKTGFTSATGFAHATRTASQRSDMASYLQVPLATVDELHNVAELATIHPKLDSPDSLQVLLSNGVRSPAALRRQLRTHRIVSFIRKLPMRATCRR